MATIDYALKRKCAELINSGMSTRDVYNSVFLPEHRGMSYETFRRKSQGWRKKHYADDRILESASLDWKFTAHSATVQVNGAGEVTQAWVKQSAYDSQAYQDLIAEIRANTAPVQIERTATGESSRMLEIPLFDMHLGIADLAYYQPTVNEILEVIESRRWEKIIIPIGQDLFHNDDFRGHTSSGRSIESVNMVKAWNDAKAIYYAIVEACKRSCDDVEIVYIRGNHDESMAWAFVQLLAERYGNADDGLSYKKVRTFGRCFIGLTHGNAKKSTARDLREQFTIKFPIEFAGAKIREIHAGHIHQEKESGDECGIMVRHLCTANKQDDWSDSEGFEGAIKRFMLFEWTRDKLAAIHYV